MVRTSFFRTIAADGEDLTALLGWVLMCLARRRLEAGGLDALEVGHLLVQERGGRGDWLTSLILTDWLEVEYLLLARGPVHNKPAPTP
jgi:hypothetical protein